MSDSQPILTKLELIRRQPFSVYSGLFFLISGFGVYYYFQSEKDRLNRKRTREASKGAGKPRIGGDFELIDQNGKKFSSEDLKGKFALVRSNHEYSQGMN